MTSKHMKKAYEAVDRTKFYDVTEAIKLLQAHAKNRKFDESIELSLNLGIDPRHSDQIVRGVTSLPHGTGKTVRVAVFAKDEKAEEAKKAGADIVGAEDLVEQINNGEINFDRAIASPDMMALVGRVAKVLGPKGLMPNPKVGTVTPNIKEAVESAKAGSLEFRAEKAGIVHAGIGKVSFKEAQLVENAKAFVDAIQKSRPSGAKGTFMRKISITSTMGPGLKLDISSLSDNQSKAA